MKKRGKMKVRWMSALLCMSMLLSNIPITAGAEGELQEVIETETEVMTEMAAEVETEAVMETEPTIETEVVTEAALETETEAETEYMTETETETETEIETETEAESNLEIEETVEEEVNENAAGADEIFKVQYLIDALPETVTQENKDAVGKQLNAIIQAYHNLSEEQQSQVNLARYEKVLDAMYVLENQAGAQIPTVVGNTYNYTYVIDSSTTFENWLDDVLNEIKDSFPSRGAVSGGVHYSYSFYLEVWDENQNKWVDYRSYNTSIEQDIYRLQSYYIDHLNQTWSKTEHTLNVSQRYCITIDCKGAPAGHGGVKKDGKAVTAVYAEKNGNVSLEIVPVDYYSHNVTVDPGNFCSVTNNGLTYSLNNVNKSLTFSVQYEPEAYSEIVFETPEGATISVNGSTNSPIRVAKNWDYDVAVNTADTYILKSVTVDGEKLTLANNKEISFKLSASEDRHTIAVTTEKMFINAKPAATVYVDNKTNVNEFVNKVFSAIYASSEPQYTAADLRAGKLKLEYDHVSAGENYFAFNLDYLPLRNYLLASPCSVRLNNGEILSNTSTLTLIDTTVSENGDIKKDYTGQPVELSMTNGVDFSWTPGTGALSSTITAYEYYDSNNNKLNGAPVDIGNYYVRIKLEERFDDYSGMSIFPYIGYSSYIPFKIVRPQVQSIESFPGNTKIYDGLPVNINFRVITNDVSDTAWEFTNGVCENFPLEVSYSHRVKGSGEFVNGLPVNAGNYEVEVTVGEVSRITEVTIQPKSLDADMVTIQPETDSYNGITHTPTILVKDGSNVLTVGTDYEVTWPEDMTSPGTKKISISGKGNYTGTVETTYQIEKGNLTGELFKIELPINLVYDKSEKTVNVDLHESVSGAGAITVEYYDKDGQFCLPVNAGTYTVKVDITEGVNYNAVSDMTIGEFIIRPQTLTVDVEVENKQYDGLTDATYKTELLGIVDGDTIALDASAVTASFEKADLAQDGIEEEIKVALSGDFDFICGENTVRDNYILQQPKKEYSAYIYNHYDAAEYTLTSNTWTNESVTITPASGYLVSTENEDAAEWKTVLTYNAETGKEGQDATFYLRNTSTNAISLPETVTYYIDTTAPTGTIKIGEQNKWSSFLDTITFGLFFKDMQTVTISAEDTLSGIGSIEYYESETPMTQVQLEGLTAAQWQSYNGTIDVTLEDAKKFIYFAKLTDNAGNITYLSTDGAVYDTTAPVIEGVEAKEYCTTQLVTVVENNLDTVKINGEIVTSPFVLAGNTETVYTIEATDKAGNSTTMTIVMKRLAMVEDTIEELNSTNVTSDQKEEIQFVLDNVQELLQNENITGEEMQQLEEMKANAEELLETIQKVKDAVSNEELKKVENVDSSNAELEDKEDLQNAKDALENALTENGANYTEEEKKKIQEEIDRIDEAIDTIKKAEEVIANITNLPEEIETDLSKEKEQELLDSKAAYDMLSEHEKSLVSEELVEKLNTLLAVLVDYQIIKGDGSQWIKGSSETITFVANGPYRKFAYIEVDEKEVDVDLYTTAEGSTVINLKASYLETLSEGKHTITVYYADGEIEGTFNILPAPTEETDSEKEETGGETEETDSETEKTDGKAEETDDNSVATGDTTNLLLWVSLMCLSVLCLAGLFVKKRIVK